MALTLPKQECGASWQRLFRGDSDGMRCMQPPCSIAGENRYACNVEQCQSNLYHEGIPFLWCALAPLQNMILHVAETDSEVTLEFELPFWIDEDDLQVDISSTQLNILVRNELSYQRSYWRNRHVMSFTLQPGS